MPAQGQQPEKEGAGNYSGSSAPPNRPQACAGSGMPVQRRFAGHMHAGICLQLGALQQLQGRLQLGVLLQEL
jgi:hypothetical protein